MTKELFRENVLDILNEGNIENYYEIKNIDILKSIISNEYLLAELYANFIKYYPLESDEDDFYAKCQDFACRLNLLVNECIINHLKITEPDKIIEIIKLQINNDIDLYSAVSYDKSDSKILIDYIEYTGGIKHEI